MIFHDFPETSSAVAFAVEVFKQHELEATVYQDVEEAMRADPIPVELVPPVVHVERSDDVEVERAVERLVESFGGSFAGT